MTPSSSEKLSQEEHDKVFRERILPDHELERFSSLNRPKAIILAGQPGAGKGGLASAAQREFNNDILLVDTDEMRKFHPEVEHFRRDNPYGWHQDTHPDARLWSPELRNAAIEGRKNILIDTTLSDGKDAVSLIKELQSKGYDVEVRAVAAHQLESELGVDARFTNLLDEKGYGRYVQEDYRGNVYRVLPDNLNQVTSETNTHIRIYDREGVVWYDSRTDTRLPGQALEEARFARIQDPTVTQQLREGWEAQAKWHQELPEQVQNKPISDPQTQLRLLEQRAALKVQDGVITRSEGAATIDELTRAGAPPARTPLPEPFAPQAARLRGTAAGVALNVVAEAYVWNETRERAQVFQQTLHNQTAARDAYVQQGMQTTAGIAGTVAGSLTATAVGAGSGGTFLLVAGEGYLFSKAADHGMQWWQNDRIYSQTDEGVQWQFNGTQWIRDDLRADLVDDGRNALHQQDFSATPEQSRRLSYRAGVEAVEQALEKVPEPRDPFSQPANDADRGHLYTGPWTYDAGNGQWSRNFADEVDRNDLPVWSAHPDIADPKRAAQLSAQAIQTIDGNLKAGPAVIAARYQAGYQALGYEHVGAQPASIAAALDPNVLQASDGKHYQRDAQSAWSHDGQVASASRALELELTRDRLLPALEQHRQHLADMPQWQPPTPEQQDRDQLRRAYAGHGVNPNPETLDASYRAVQNTRTEHGLGPQNSSLTLAPDAQGQYSIHSPIQHLHRDADGAVRIAATTSTAEIDAALPSARPHQAAPEHRHTHATAEQRDAREQAQREANRQGLSQDDAQQAVHAAVVGASARWITPGYGAARAAVQEQDATQARREFAQDTPATQEVPQAATTAAAMTRDARDADATRLERERANTEQHREAERTARDLAQSDKAQAMDVDRPLVAPTNERDREPVPQTTAEPDTRTTTNDRQASPPAIETFRGQPQTVATTPERELSPEPERTTANLETTATPEHRIETTPVTAERESQDARSAATSSPATKLDPDALRLGDRGDAVELLQYRLDRQGYRGPEGERLPQTGQYGAETEHAVRQFQTMHGMAATGIADRDTRDAVDRALAAQRERERGEQGLPARSLSADSAQAHEIEAPVVLSHSAGMSMSSVRSRDDKPEHDIEPVARTEAPTAAAVMDPALAHRSAMRDDHNGGREQDRKQAHDPRASTEPHQPAPALMTQPGHSAHTMYTQALSLIERGDLVPAGTMTQEEKSRLAAGVVAQFLASDMFATRIDGIYASTHNAAGTGMPASLIPVQGDPTTAHCHRAGINVEQALQASLEQSSSIAQVATIAREEELTKQRQREQEQEQNGPTGPTMRIGARTLTPSQGPQGDGGGGGGAGGGGGGAGGGGGGGGG